MGEVDVLVWAEIGDVLGDCERVVGIKVLIGGREEAYFVFTQNLYQGLTGGAFSSDDV